MTTDTEVSYETKTVRAIRGMESRTIKKWVDEGWEVVSQTPGKLQTEITLRRPKPKSRLLLWLVGGGVFALVLATIITFGVIGERNAVPAESAAPAPRETTTAPREPSSEPTEASTPDPEPEEVALTPENSPELVALLAMTDYCAPEVAAFAAAHGGQTIAFPGYIGAMNPHGSAATRYDIGVGAGDFSETSATGPSFQFRDVNVTNDLHFVGPVPDTIGVRLNLGITATIDHFEESSCLFLIKPITTTVR